MHVHILGIAGTFMGGIAAIAKAAGHRVTGSDLNVYPPMSTQLAALGIELSRVMPPTSSTCGPTWWWWATRSSRGRPVIEAMLDRGLPYTSGPLWLADQVLKDRHGCSPLRAPTARRPRGSMLAWILEHAGSRSRAF